MKEKTHPSLLKRFFVSLFVFLFSCLGFSALSNPTPVYAIEEKSTETSKTEESTEKPKKSQEEIKEEAKIAQEEAGNICSEQSGALGFIICPGTGAISKAIDAIYDVIEQFLTVEPLSTDNTSTIHLVWEYARNLTNIVFIIFLLIVIYSQLTGLGISNYGIKRVLPRIIIAALLVNLSFIICQLAVDVSNILGYSLRGFFTSVQTTAIANGAIPATTITWTDLVDALTGSTLLVSLGITITGGFGALFWTLLPIIIGALVAVAIGLITIAMRQALVALLVMISPLAFVCYLLPNTETWFKKWKELLIKMLIFYPAFSVLYGASELAGWAILTSSKDAFGIILGLAVQIFPLFFSWTLMKMSGTILGTINQKLSGIAAKPLSSLNTYSQSRREQQRQKYFASSSSIGASTYRFALYRKKLREQDTENLKTINEKNAEELVQRKISAGYSSSNYNRRLRANPYTRHAKQALNAKMTADIATKDTAHVMDGYGKYYGDASAQDARIGQASAQNWLEYNRATFTETADEEADFDFLVDEYIRMNALGPGNKQFEHYIKSVSPDGKFNVMGQLINRAATVEARRRRDYNTMIAKWNFDKRNFRNMAIGYYNNDDGLAVDLNGNKLEKQPGYLLTHDPSQLVLYDKKDENGRLYFDWYDQGKYVMRVYRDDSAFMKEAFSNFDTIINDPENALYGILAGVQEGDVKEAGRNNEYNAKYKNIGLAKYATTLGRAILAAGYKEKNASFSPYLAEMIKQRRIKTTGQMNIAMIDSFIKGAKAGNFVTMDQFSLDQFAYILDPRNFDIAFPDSDIEAYVDVNNNSLHGLNERGEKVPRERASVEEKKRKFKNDYLMVAMNMMLQMMTKDTPNIRENQKPSAADKLAQVKSSIEQWAALSETDPLIMDIHTKNPYQKTVKTSYSAMAHEIKNKLESYNKVSSDPTPAPAPTINVISEIENIHRVNTDALDFQNAVFSTLSGHDEFSGIIEQFNDYIINNPDASAEDLYNELLEICRYFGLD